jgi:hypothetical protein
MFASTSESTGTSRARARREHEYEYEYEHEHEHEHEACGSHTGWGSFLFSPVPFFGCQPMMGGVAYV